MVYIPVPGGVLILGGLQASSEAAGVFRCIGRSLAIKAGLEQVFGNSTVKSERKKRCICYVSTREVEEQLCKRRPNRA
jgi:hypothetical protein